MRSYGKITSGFWQSTVKMWRGDSDAITVALYLCTNPHANMLGLYHCPIMFIGYETGLSEEGASKALQRVSEGAFCTYDHDNEYVWVHEMAATEIATELKPGDNRHKSVVKQLLLLPKTPLLQGFWDRYSRPFKLEGHPELERFLDDLQAPWKPLGSQKQVQGQEQGQPQGQGQGHFPIQERREDTYTRVGPSRVRTEDRASPLGRNNTYAQAKEGA